MKIGQIEQESTTMQHVQSSSLGCVGIGPLNVLSLQSEANEYQA